MRMTLQNLNADFGLIIPNANGFVVCSAYQIRTIATWKQNRIMLITKENVPE